jgi:hypothetical protein
MPPIDAQKSLKMSLDMKTQARYKRRLKELVEQMAAESLPKHDGVMELKKEVEQEGHENIVSTLYESNSDSRNRIETSTRIIAPTDTYDFKRNIFTITKEVDLASIVSKIDPISETKEINRNVTDPLSKTRDILKSVNFAESAEDPAKDVVCVPKINVLAKAGASPNKVMVPASQEVVYTGPINDFEKVENGANTFKNAYDSANTDHVDNLVNVVDGINQVKSSDDNGNNVENIDTTLDDENNDDIYTVVETLSFVINKIVPSFSFGITDGDLTSYDDYTDSAIEETKSEFVDKCSASTVDNSKSFASTQTDYNYTTTKRFITTNYKEVQSKKEETKSDELNDNCTTTGDSTLFVTKGIVSSNENCSKPITDDEDDVTDSSRSVRKQKIIVTPKELLPQQSKQDLHRTIADVDTFDTTKVETRFEPETDTNNAGFEVEPISGKISKSVNIGHVRISNRSVYKPYITKFAAAKESYIAPVALEQIDDSKNLKIPRAMSLFKGRSIPVGVKSWKDSNILNSTEHTSKTDNKSMSPKRKLKAVGIQDPARTKLTKGNRDVFLKQLHRLSRRHVHATDPNDDLSSIAIDSISHADAYSGLPSIEQQATTVDNRLILSEPIYFDDDEEKKNMNAMETIVSNLLDWSDSFACKDLGNALKCNDLVQSLVLPQLGDCMDFESVDGSVDQSEGYSYYFDSLNPKRTVDPLENKWSITSMLNRQNELLTSNNLFSLPDKIEVSLPRRNQVTNENIKTNSNMGKRMTSSIISDNESTALQSIADTTCDWDENIDSSASTNGLLQKMEHLVLDSADEIMQTIRMWSMDEIDSVSVYSKNVDTSDEYGGDVNPLDTSLESNLTKTGDFNPLDISFGSDLTKTDDFNPLDTSFGSNLTETQALL